MENIDKNQQLAELECEYKDCTKCELCKSRTQIVFHRGGFDSRIVICGEASGATEDLQGKPFVGRSGKLLDNMIKSIGLEPEQVYICNACLCRPPNNRKPTQEEILACQPRLIKQLEIISPKIIIALGSTAAEALLGPGPSVTKRRAGLHSFNNIPVKVTYHPSYCLRRQDMKAEVWKDLQDVLNFLKEEK